MERFSDEPFEFPTAKTERSRIFATLNNDTPSASEAALDKIDDGRIKYLQTARYHGFSDADEYIKFVVKKHGGDRFAIAREFGVDPGVDREGLERVRKRVQAIKGLALKIYQWRKAAPAGRKNDRQFFHCQKHPCIGCVNAWCGKSYGGTKICRRCEAPSQWADWAESNRFTGPMKSKGGSFSTTTHHIYDRVGYGRAGAISP